MVNCILLNMSSSQHNHPPLPGLIDGCVYCYLHGNILKHGTVTSDKMCFFDIHKNTFKKLNNHNIQKIEHKKN